jgi:hypothetical protein
MKVERMNSATEFLTPLTARFMMSDVAFADRWRHNRSSPAANSA